MKAALFSAFPQEVTYIIKSLGAEKIRRSPFVTWSGHAGSKEVVIVETGMGAGVAGAAWKYAVDEYSPDYVISAGFCGALYEGSSIGDLVGASRVLLYPAGSEAVIQIPGAREVMRKLTAAVPVCEGSILTLMQRLKKAEIEKELIQALPSPVCDMETFALAELSIGKGLPFFAIRAVSDRAGEEIPAELFAVTGADGSFSLLRALGIILGNPRLIPACIRVGKNARLASQKLSRAVEALLRIL